MKLTLTLLFFIHAIIAFSQKQYSITEFGAKGDDKTINTGFIQKAIDKCASDGGGQVYIPGGVFLSGTIQLKSAVTLYLSQAAVLKGIGATEPFSRNAFIYAEKQKGIAVAGPGKIYGQGEAKVFADDPATGVNNVKGRPMAISFLHCNDIKLKEFTISNSASWGIKLKECGFITVDDISILSYVVGNNDGIDIVDCNNVRLSNSLFNCGDDAICMKSESKTGVKNITINNCIASSGSNAIKMGTAGIGGFEDITIANCALSNTRLSGIAIEMVDGGTINRVAVSNITMHNVNGSIFIKLGKRKGDKPGILKNVVITGIVADGIGEWRPDTTASYFKRHHDPRIGMSIVGQPGYAVENIILSNIYLQFSGGGTAADAKRPMNTRPEAYPEYNNFGVTPAYGMNLKHVRNIQANNIRLDYIKDDLRPAIFMEDVEGIDTTSIKAKINKNDLLKYVDPFIGTGGHGHTYPGATVPFGMVQLSPDNGTQGWDWCSGYHYSDLKIEGFSHTHLSGTGVGDWCDISVMPSLAPVPDTTTHFRTSYQHKNEKASPGYYAVTLDNGIQASFTATERCGFHNYRFPKGSSPVLRFNLAFHINQDRPTETFIQKINDSTIVGYRYSTGWAKVQRIYFAARTSQAFNSMQVKDKFLTAQLFFPENTENIQLKVALSTVSAEKALLALTEIQGWDFEQTKLSAEHKWEAELQKIKISTNDEKLKRIFYTALYHTCMAPVLYSDADGTYQNAAGSILKMDKGAQRYTVFSLWDTFRALNPLFTITQPVRNTDILNSMLAFYKETGLLPVWDLSTWETNTMSGYHAVPVLSDAVLKNTPGIDPLLAYEAMKKSSVQTIRGTPDYIKYGYLPQDKAGYSVTITLEYAYDDWCIAQVAKKLGNKKDYDLYMKRAGYYASLFDKASGFIRAKNSDGSWVLPFDPYLSEHSKKAQYMEGNAWQHSFFVPHDPRGLAALHGGRAAFIKKLDSLFTIKSDLHGDNTSLDVTGLIGQYAHGNEPSHHIAYLYSYAGQPWKTQEKVRLIMDSMYHDQPDGYSGNEDCGQMSAWAIWNICGLYPANPASGQYVFGSPMIDEAVIQLPGNKQFTIKVNNASAKNIYISSIKLNGKPYTQTFIDHSTLIKGGLLEFEMTDKPVIKQNIPTADLPYSVNN